MSCLRSFCLRSIALAFWVATPCLLCAAPQVATPQVGAPKSGPPCVAEVNGEEIAYDALAREVLEQFGRSLLGDEIRRALIVQACEARKIALTDEEVAAEIRRFARAFGTDSETWLKMLDDERGIKPAHYITDTIQPLILLSKLASEHLVVTQDEVRQEYERRFGASVKVRQIVLPSQAEAERVRAELVANPTSFETVAKSVSIDPSSKPFGGLVQPIRHYTMTPAIEEAVFALQEGEVSRVVAEGHGLFMIFKCEQHFPSQSMNTSDELKNEIVAKIRDVKTRDVSEAVFRQLQQQTPIEVFFGNPTKAAQQPLLAAMVGGKPITMADLTERCVARKGAEVLDEMISRTIVVQACRRHNINITEADIDREVREMAVKNLPLKKDGQPNIEQWLNMAIQERGTTVESYRRNTVFPMLALKLIVRGRVAVTEDDVAKGFEANFGAKVRCLGIVLDNQRRAMEVWQKASQFPSEESFADLASQYSADTITRNSRGVMPLIQKHGGEPTLEKEAFNLKVGEISQIVQLDLSHWIILYCLGQTPPESVVLDDVKHEIVADIYDKKLRLAITRFYEETYAAASIDNYITGRSTGPATASAATESDTTEAATPKPIR